MLRVALPEMARTASRSVSGAAGDGVVGEDQPAGEKDLAAP